MSSRTPPRPPPQRPSAPLGARARAPDAGEDFVPRHVGAGRHEALEVAGGVQGSGAEGAAAELGGEVLPERGGVRREVWEGGEAIHGRGGVEWRGGEVGGLLGRWEVWWGLVGGLVGFGGVWWGLVGFGGVWWGLVGFGGVRWGEVGGGGGRWGEVGG